MAFKTTTDKKSLHENKIKDKKILLKSGSKIETTDHKRKGKKLSNSYKVYIFKVLKGLYEDIGISSKAMDIMDSFMNDMFEKISVEASEIARQNKRNTISFREIETAVKLVLGGELAKNALCEGIKALERFSKS